MRIAVVEPVVVQMIAVAVEPVEDRMNAEQEEEVALEEIDASVTEMVAVDAATTVTIGTVMTGIELHRKKETLVGVRIRSKRKICIGET